MKTVIRRAVVTGLLLVGLQPEAASGQTASLWQRSPPPATSADPAAPATAQAPVATLQNSSWIYVQAQPPREIRIHDIISVRVDHLARMTAEGELQRRKNSKYDARLKDWIVFEGLRAVRPDPQTPGDPRILGELQSNYRSQGDMQTRESLAFNLACEVVDIRPNGNLVLEGRGRVRVNDEVWVVSLSGECAATAVGPDNTVLSRDIHHLDVDKGESGSVATGYQRGWFQKLFDVIIQPF